MLKEIVEKIELSSLIIKDTLDTGNGNDKVKTKEMHGSIYTRDGNDLVIVTAQVKGLINLGNDNDSIIIKKVHQFANIIGGEGEDSIHIIDMKISDWNGKKNFSDKIMGFENIKIGDVVVKGDANVFNNSFFKQESTPLILDLDGDGIETLSLKDRVLVKKL